MLNVVHIFAGHGDALQRGLRREYDALLAAALVVEGDFHDLVILAVDGVAVHGLHLHILAVSVVVARLLELFFLGGEALDDLLHRDAFGLRRTQRAFLGEDGKSQCGKEQNEESGISFHTIQQTWARAKVSLVSLQLDAWRAMVGAKTAMVGAKTLNRKGHQGRKGELKDRLIALDDTRLSAGKHFQQPALGSTLVRF